MQITRELAQKVLQVVDAGLVKGMGRPSPGNMCVEAAVCYAMNLPHGDEPPCVHAYIRAIKIGINDIRWSSKFARAKGMRRLAVAQLGSKDVLYNNYSANALFKEVVKDHFKHTMFLDLIRLLGKYGHEFPKDFSKIANDRYVIRHSDGIPHVFHSIAWYIEGGYLSNIPEYIVILLDMLNEHEGTLDAYLTQYCECIIAGLRAVDCPGVRFMDELCPIGDK